jgi:hypothetical protein
MDIFYGVKQLAHEITTLEAQILEKKTALLKLWPTLTHQEQHLLNSPSTPDPVPETAPGVSPKTPIAKKSEGK